MIIVMHDLIADFLKLGIIMIYSMFMLFLSICIGCYLYGFLDTHITGV